MSGIDILFLLKEDVDSLSLSNQEILNAVEMGLRAHGEKKVIRPSKDHISLDYPEKLFNILKGFAISDIVVGHLAYERAKERGVITWLPYYAHPEDI